MAAPKNIVRQRAAVLSRQLARDVISMAQTGGMPDTYWQTDQRIARACAVLNITPEQARDTDFTLDLDVAPDSPVRQR